jgi:hypothetical protein
MVESKEETALDLHMVLRNLTGHAEDAIKGGSYYDRHLSLRQRYLRFPDAGPHIRERPYYEV